MIFPWQKNREKSGDFVDLVYESELDPCSRTSWVKSVYYSIREHGTGKKVGECDLRIGMNDEIYYAGQIGYRIYEPYRGNGYAYEACRLLFAVAKDCYAMHELVITCSPENLPSLRTLEKLGGELIETTDVPRSHWLYQRGERVKNIYHYNL